MAPEKLERKDNTDEDDDVSKIRQKACSYPILESKRLWKTNECLKGLSALVISEEHKNSKNSS